MAVSQEARQAISVEGQLCWAVIIVVGCNLGKKYQFFKAILSEADLGVVECELEQVISALKRAVEHKMLFFELGTCS